MQLQERDFFRQRLSEAELRQLLAGRPAEELFAWKSVKARQQRLQPGQFSDVQLVGMMAEEPTFIRRPVIRVGDRWVAGFNQTELERLLRSG